MKEYEYLWGLPISCLSLEGISKKIIKWATKKESKVVYCCGMSDITLAKENQKVDKCLKNSDLLTADGMPLVFLMRKRRGKNIERGYGPDIFNMILEVSKDNKLGHFFLGTTNDNLNKLVNIVKTDLNNKNIMKYYSPPFKEVFNQSDLDKMVELINDKKVNIVWVGMGSLKQIVLADYLKKKVPGKVIITVGAAFDFFTKNKAQAPVFIQNIGLEWLFRWVYEPKRLTSRYLRVIIFMINELIENAKKRVSVLKN